MQKKTSVTMKPYELLGAVGTGWLKMRRHLCKSDNLRAFTDARDVNFIPSTVESLFNMYSNFLTSKNYVLALF